MLKLYCRQLLGFSESTEFCGGARRVNIADLVDTVAHYLWIQEPLIKGYEGITGYNHCSAMMHKVLQLKVMANAI